MISASERAALILLRRPATRGMEAVMRIVESLGVWTGLALLAAMAACGGADDSTEGGSEADATQFGGTTLTSSADPGLRIKIQMLDGVQSKTHNRRFIKATVSRGGKSFSAWCDQRGAKDVDGSVVHTVSCSKGVTTVSNDDDESLSFDIEQRVSK